MLRRRVSNRRSREKAERIGRKAGSDACLGSFDCDAEEWVMFSTGRTRQGGLAGVRKTYLVDDAGGEVGILRLQVELAKGLLILVQILSKHIPQGLGLLRAEVDALVVEDLELFGALRVGLAKDEVEIPYADANLHAVGVGVAVAGGLGEVDAGLLVALAHSVNRLLREA